MSERDRYDEPRSSLISLGTDVPIRDRFLQVAPRVVVGTP